MKNTRSALLMTVAAAALAAGAGVAFAQTPPSSGAQVAPVEKMAPPKDVTKDKAPGAGMKSGKTDEKMERKGDKTERAQDNPKTDGKPTIRSETMSPGKTGSGMEPDNKRKVEMRDSGKTGESKARAVDRDEAGRSVKLSNEQRTTFHTAIRNHNAQPMRNVNFAISVGSRVPRSVHFYPMPDELVRYYPHWRGYDYFLVGDEILVVNPRTHEIVAVLDA